MNDRLSLHRCVCLDLKSNLFRESELMTLLRILTIKNINGFIYRHKSSSTFVMVPD